MDEFALASGRMTHRKALTTLRVSTFLPPAIYECIIPIGFQDLIYVGKENTRRNGQHRFIRGASIGVDHTVPFSHGPVDSFYAAPKRDAVSLDGLPGNKVRLIAAVARSVRRAIAAVP